MIGADTVVPRSPADGRRQAKLALHNPRDSRHGGGYDALTERVEAAGIEALACCLSGLFTLCGLLKFRPN